MNGISALRRFARERPPRIERCELCGTPIGPRHDHLVDPRQHQLKCACQACAVLFPQHADAKFRRVTPRAELLAEFKLSDARWDSLGLPIGLAFFLAAGKGIAAFYPGPAGATESLVSLDAWEEIARENALVLAPDVEALLVHRVGKEREHYLVSVDHCYRLVGILRKSWRGFSGGEEAATHIRHFFDELRGGARA
jgi:uncharacterized protein DUF5947